MHVYERECVCTCVCICFNGEKGSRSVNSKVPCCCFDLFLLIQRLMPGFRKYHGPRNNRRLTRDPGTPQAPGQAHRNHPWRRHAPGGVQAELLVCNTHVELVVQAAWGGGPSQAAPRSPAGPLRCSRPRGHCASTKRCRRQGSSRRRSGRCGPAGRGVGRVTPRVQGPTAHTRIFRACSADNATCDRFARANYYYSGSHLILSSPAAAI